jgi:membrane protein involved in colicin uptake
MNAVMGALQSAPGGSDPNAVVNAGNQQAAAIRATGDANAAQQQAAVQQRLAAQQAAQQVAQEKAASQQAQQAQQTAKQTNSSGTAANSSGSGSGGTSGGDSGTYLAPITLNCVREFWDRSFTIGSRFKTTAVKPSILHGSQGPE